MHPRLLFKLAGIVTAALRVWLSNFGCQILAVSVCRSVTSDSLQVSCVLFSLFQSVLCIFQSTSWRRKSLSVPQVFQLAATRPYQRVEMHPLVVRAMRGVTPRPPIFVRNINVGVKIIRHHFAWSIEIGVRKLSTKLHKLNIGTCDRHVYASRSL